MKELKECAIKVVGSNRGMIGMAYPTHHQVYENVRCNQKRFRIQDILNHNPNQTVYLEMFG